MSTPSITTRRGTLACTMAATVAASAVAFGKLTMMVGALAGEVAGIGGDDDAAARKRAPSRRGNVVADHAPAGGEKVLRESAAHDAETDDHRQRLCFFAARTSFSLS